MNPSTPTPEQIEAFTKTASFLEGQSQGWWVAALFLLFVGTGMVVLYMLFRFHRQYIDGLNNQLSEQRAAHAEATKMLINYVTMDHVQSLATLKEVGQSLKEVGAALLSIRQHQQS